MGRAFSFGRGGGLVDAAADSSLRRRFRSGFGRNDKVWGGFAPALAGMTRFLEGFGDEVLGEIREL
jgi:hypothetical protein